MSNLRAVTLAFMLFMLIIGCANQENTDAAGETATPFDAEKLIGAWVGLWNSYDLSLVDELFLISEDLTYFSSEKEGVIVGIDAVKEHHVGFGFVEGGKAVDTKLWVEDLHTSTFENSAVVTGIWFFQRADGTKQRGPVTFVYVQIGTEYRLAHLHFANYPESEGK